MAKRPIFIPRNAPEHLVDEVQIEFGWNPGFAPIQKMKNITALHEAARSMGWFPLLEVSTKSGDPLGQRLSAFSLTIETPVGDISVEAAYQGSKVFESGGPFRDLYEAGSRQAKQDLRLRESGALACFDYFGQEWPIIPRTAFYDWLYLTALKPHQEYLDRLSEFKGFTDIEFNPRKSITCQARTCALIVSLIRLQSLEESLQSQGVFIDMISSDSLKQSHSADLIQGQLPLDT